MEYRIAIIGPEAAVSGFRMLGADAYHAATSAELVERVIALQKQSNNDTSEQERYGVIMVIESLLRDVSKEEYAKMTKYTLPAVVALPGMEGSNGRSQERLKELTEKAIGTDIM